MHLYSNSVRAGAGNISERSHGIKIKDMEEEISFNIAIRPRLLLQVELTNLSVDLLSPTNKKLPKRGDWIIFSDII